MRSRAAPTRRITRGNLWGILQGRLHVLMSDLRRQFQIESDDVTPIQTSEGTFYVGLPADGAAVLGQLWHEGRIVFDCTPDLRAMVVRAIASTRPTRPPPSRTSTARPSASRPISGRPADVADVGVSPSVADQAGVARTAKPTAGTEVSYTVGPTSEVSRSATGFEVPDDFLPAPSVDAFGPGDEFLPVAPSNLGPPSEPHGTGVNGDERWADATDEVGATDGSGRRRRRGGIGRAARAR
jgi:hypothetical protein